MNGKMPEQERVNFHCHCERCGHAVGTVGDYAAEAVKKGLVRLGFSDHIPYPGDPLDYQMPYRDLEAYLNEVTELQQELRGTLTIYRGFESEYFKARHDYYESILAREDCDYLLLGQHFFETDAGKIVSVYDVPDTALYEEYSRGIVEAMKTGLFRYVAHPDMIFYSNHPWDVHCEKSSDILIEGSLRYGVPLECNANGIRRGEWPFADGKRYQYPHLKFWDKAAAAGVQAYVGSDCHEPEHLWDEAVEKAYEILRERSIQPRTDW